MEYDEDAQVEQLRRWWSENWKALAAGLTLGLGGILGWETWQSSQRESAETASQVYEDLKAAVASKPERAADLGQALMRDYAGTPYAAQGALLLASLSANNRDWPSAEELLTWVVKNADDEGLRKVARLRLARVYWQQDRPDEALAQLELPEGDPFGPLYLELRGDIRLSQGDRAAAREHYEQAMKLGPPQNTRDFLQHKLDDLSDVES